MELNTCYRHCECWINSERFWGCKKVLSLWNVKPLELLIVDTKTSYFISVVLKSVFIVVQYPYTPADKHILT